MNKNMKTFKFKCSHCDNVIVYEGRINQPRTCIKCNHPYSMKPPTEYKLFLLQDKFLTNKSNRTNFHNFYEELIVYIKKLILKKLKGKIYLDGYYIDEKVQDTMSKLSIYYFSKDNFKIEGSFAGYIEQALLDILYNRKRVREENHDSLNFRMDDANDNELIDSLFSFGYSTLSNDTGSFDVEDNYINKDNTIVNEIMYNIDYLLNDNIMKKKFSLADRYLFLLGLEYFFEKQNESFTQKYYDYVGTNLTLIIEQFKLILKTQLYKDRKVEDYE
jgi:hypothetical protein